MTGSLSTVVAIPCQAWTDGLPGAESLVRQGAEAAYAAASAEVSQAEVSIVLGDDGMIQKLNRDFRKIDAPTNVLSFPLGAGPGSPGAGPLMLGDVVVAFETASAEAAGEGKRLGDHLVHLVVHGVLHLLGYDHQADAEAEAMERLETKVLSSLGIADPYRPEQGAMKAAER